MTQATPIEIRREIWQRKKAKATNAAISETLKISLPTVMRILKRTPDDLKARYERCGKNGREQTGVVREVALKLKREHPRWGAVVIQLELCGSLNRVPGERTLQRWFRQAGLHRRRERAPSTPRNKGLQVHDVWELDAKEQLTLADGSRASVMMAVDEASGAVIGTAPFSPSQASMRYRRTPFAKPCVNSSHNMAVRWHCALTMAGRGASHKTPRVGWHCELQAWASQ